MDSKLKVKINYKTFDESKAIREAQQLVDKLKCRKIKLNAYRLDADTIVQIKEGRQAGKIIERIKSKRRSINLTDYIEYGQYA